MQWHLQLLATVIVEIPTLKPTEARLGEHMGESFPQARISSVRVVKQRACHFACTALFVSRIRIRCAVNTAFIVDQKTTKETLVRNHRMSMTAISVEKTIITESVTSFAAAHHS